MSIAIAFRVKETQRQAGKRTWNMGWKLFLPSQINGSSRGRKRPATGIRRALDAMRRVLSTAIPCLLVLQNHRLLAQEEDVVRPPSLKVVVVSGQSATNNIKTRKAVEPVVSVSDERGQPVSGVLVVFTLPETGPGGAFADDSKRAIVYTNTEGRATVRGLRPNMTPGNFQIMVNASFHGLTASTSIHQTNILPERGRGGSSKLVAILAIAGGAAAAGIVAAGSGGGSSQNPLPPPTSTATTIVPGTPSFGPPQQ
ncbi:MAG: hypothetical protein L0387_38050 [Acidobacteria bacterium]|nr:hypothetical protein [Acidobacteriota bacterium]MCI0717521.1 hypothetical protein [Acidobacteriota bacterium]